MTKITVCRWSMLFIVIVFKVRSITLKNSYAKLVQILVTNRANPVIKAVGFVLIISGYAHVYTKRWFHFQKRGEYAIIMACVCVCLWNTVRQEWWILCIFDEKNCHIRRKHPIVLVTSRLFYRSPKFRNWKLCSHKVGSMETFHIWHMAYGCIIEGSRTFLFL